jgi:hypothetical protein
MFRGASPLGLPCTLTREPLRRLAPFAWLVRCAHSLRCAPLAHVGDYLHSLSRRSASWCRREGGLLRLPMRRVLSAEAAELAELEPLGRLLLVLGRAVVAPFALLARQRDDVSHVLRPGSQPRVRGSRFAVRKPNPRTREPANRDLKHYSMISEIVPAPTVRPPSRIANRAPFSSATGTCSSAVMLVLSPGITISTPSGSFSDPVTSVVRM